MVSIKKCTPFHKIVIYYGQFFQGKHTEMRSIPGVGKPQRFFTVVEPFIFEFVHRYMNCTFLFIVWK